MPFTPSVTDTLSLIVLMVGMATFALAVVATRIGRGAGGERSVRDQSSWLGVAVQAAAYFLATGPVLAHPSGRADTPRVAAVTLLMAGGVGLFAWAARAMGRNWAIVARTLQDHALVTEGPFALVRNPIYLAMLFILLGVAAATGHLAALAVAIPIFAVGTAMRIRSEERLLRAEFGDAYDRYALRVKRILPGLL